MIMLQQDNDVVLANRYSICTSCKKKMLEADKKLRPSKAKEQLEGKFDGQFILKIPGAKDAEGEKVYLCKDCLKEYLVELDATH